VEGRGRSEDRPAGGNCLRVEGGWERGLMVVGVEERARLRFWDDIFFLFCFGFGFGLACLFVLAMGDYCRVKVDVMLGGCGVVRFVMGCFFWGGGERCDGDGEVVMAGMRCESSRQRKFHVVDNPTMLQNSVGIEKNRKFC
jgi:hypothetical protein